MTSALREIARTFNLSEADVICSRLVGAGLNPTLQNEQASQTLGSIYGAGGIRVMVPAEEYEQASALLKAEPTE